MKIEMESSVYGAQCSFDIVPVVIVVSSATFLVSLMLSATLMIIKRFVVVTKSHWHILWADVALLLPCRRRCLPATNLKHYYILSWDQIKYISTWLGIVNIDLFARAMATSTDLAFCWIIYSYTLFWHCRRDEPNADLLCVSNTTNNCIEYERNVVCIHTFRSLIFITCVAFNYSWIQFSNKN